MDMVGASTSRDTNSVFFFSFSVAHNVYLLLSPFFMFARRVVTTRMSDFGIWNLISKYEVQVLF